MAIYFFFMVIFFWLIFITRKFILLQVILLKKTFQIQFLPVDQKQPKMWLIIFGEEMKTHFFLHESEHGSGF